MTKSEYIAKIKNVKGNRVHRITNSHTTKEAYRYFCKISNIVDEKTYRKIIRLVNYYIREELSLGNKIVLPCFMGAIELRKLDSPIKIIDGKVRTRRPVDWDATLSLWYEDEEAAKNKTLVRVESPEIFRVYYNRTKAKYKNKAFYEFNTNRELKKILKTNVKAGIVDAYSLIK